MVALRGGIRRLQQRGVDGFVMSASSLRAEICTEMLERVEFEINKSDCNIGQ
jgi:hypothetical protein